MRTSVGILVVALLASSTAFADQKSKKAKAEAKAHLDKAAAASKEGRDADALTELDAAYELDPQPNVLFARAQLNAKLSKCEDALKEYEAFVATSPPPDQALLDMANQGIETCKAALAPPPPPPPEPTKVTEQELEADQENPTTEKIRVAPAKAEPKPTEPKVAAPAGPRHWYKDPILLGLGVGAVATVTGSVIFYVAARGYVDDSESAPNYNEWRLFVEDAHRARRYAVICAAGGAALAGATVLYFVQRYTGQEEPSMTVAPTKGGATVGWTGHF